MRRIKTIFMTLVALVMAGCTSSEVPNPADMDSAGTRAIGTDLRKIGALHNEALDFAATYLAEHPTCKVGDFENNLPLQAFHISLTSFMEKNTPEVIGCTASQVKISMDDAKYIWDTPEDADLLQPIIINGSSFELSGVETCIDQVEALKVLTHKEILFLRSIAELTDLDKGQMPSNAVVEERLNSLVTEWEAEYGKKGYIGLGNSMTVSGIPLSVAVSSFQWWTDYYSGLDNGQQRLAPLLAYVLGKDAKGALSGVLLSLLNGNRDLKTIALDGLKVGVIHSILCLL